MSTALARQIGLPGQIHVQGLIIAREMTFDEWEAALRMAEFMEAASPWVTVDLVAYGEARFGEDASQAYPTAEDDPTGERQAKLKQAGWMASRWPPEARVQGASYTHHRLVAKLDRDEARGLLVAATHGGWSTRDLAREVKARELALPAESSPAPSCAADVPFRPTLADLLPEWRMRAEASGDPAFAAGYLSALIDTRQDAVFSRWED